MKYKIVDMYIYLYTCLDKHNACSKKQNLQKLNNKSFLTRYKFKGRKKAQN